MLMTFSSASVSVDAQVVGAIDDGLLILLGVGHDDAAIDADLLAEKIAQLRIFSNDAGRFDRSLLDVGGAALVVSQFTLYGDTRKGRRPSFTAAAEPAHAEPLVEAFAAALRALGIAVAQGMFGAAMEVSLVNQGPVTLILDTEQLRQPRRQS